jgi:lysophospholipase L1-like esterase
VTQRRHRRFLAIGVVLLAGCLAFAAWAVSRTRAPLSSSAVSSRAVSSVLLQPGQAATAHRPPKAMLSVAAPLAACEARIEHQPHRLPVVAIVGASYTAGVGPGNPDLSWAVVLARQLRWNAVVYGVPGAGYVRPSGSGRGPMTRMLGAEALRQLDPALVIVQAGHDDLGVPPAFEQRRVGATVAQIRAAAPQARIALLTTFAAGSDTGSPELQRLDHAIITAGRAADPGVVIMDPLGGRWTYPRASDGLHPTAAGDAWLARTAAAILRSHGVLPAAATSDAPVICDVSVGVRHPVSA